ncbi:uncharacterized protein B0H18DRAFT_1121712 [Fomitopsis serialis]|uniref:uncharacterized protein n=1 Tax=Fomitopsis serialis TaxID=139415 RepID=UPI0020088249|nr:uncharacterized protein B0H18DRAFT_1121712 [Neoantrodia serialis]KAH9920753.1 hypothetical protein B0H18DRAFT_1121712 [Neoantrodia serialis]
MAAFASTGLNVPRHPRDHPQAPIYSPFRSDNIAELVRETTAAQVELHERYCSKSAAKALNPDPHKRSLSGFCRFLTPRARWNTAINGTIALSTPEEPEQHAVRQR